MTVQFDSSNQTIEQKKYCIICRNKIEDPNNAYQTSVNLSLVCKKCQKKFSRSDLELIAGIFIAFGGYFGCLKHKERSVDDIINDAIIKKVFSDLKHQESKKARIEEINIRVLHQMLMHGFTPQDYLLKLNTLVLNEK